MPGGPGRVSNVVFMGMGEPMANYKAVIGAVRRLTEPVPDGLGLSARHITVSTVGLVPAIEKLTAEAIPVTPGRLPARPGRRAARHPGPGQHPLERRRGARRRLALRRATKRRVSIEYALIKDINDQAWRADRLGRMLRNKLVHVNLIPLNPTPGSKWTASRPQDEAEFVRRLRSGASRSRSATPAAGTSTGLAASSRRR